MTAIVGFIDLLATKESSRVSQLSTDAAIKSFLGCLILNKIILGKEKCEIRCLSDSAFFQLPSPEVAVMFLQRLRKDLFDRKLYFKCGIVAGELETSTLDVNFLSDFINRESVRSKIDGMEFPELADSLAEDVQGFYFSRSAVQAYELHEAFKGVGYTLSRSARSKLEAYSVKSLYFLDDRLERSASYYDMTFENDFELGQKSAREVLPEQDMPDLTKLDSTEENEMAIGLTYINALLRSLQISTIKNKSYTKYYLPTLISIIRSASYSDMHVEDGRIVDAPTIYKRLVEDNALGRMKPRPKGVNRVLACLLNASLENIKAAEAAEVSAGKSKHELEMITDHDQSIEETKKLVCFQFSTIPNFVGSIHETTDSLLSAKNREYFLDCVVK